jgi:hypothetical protein
MASYIGIQYNTGSDEPALPWSTTPATTTATRATEDWDWKDGQVADDPQTDGVRSVYGPHHIGISRRCILPYSVGENFIFNRVWVEPMAIEHGFITEDSTDNITIWNAWLYRDVDFTQTDSIEAEGTALTTIPTLPHTIQQNSHETLVLTTYRLGPPTQDTTWQFEVDGAWHDVTVTGTRVVQCKPCPNWARGVDIRYDFQTVMFETERFVEQRRPMMDEPTRTLSASYLLRNDAGREFFHAVMYAHDKVFAVPIYNELLVCSNIPNGGTTITTTTATTNMYNLNNLCTYVAIADHAANETEVKEIDSIGANSIVVDSAIAGTFDVNTARVYPIVVGLVSRADITEETEEYSVVRVEYAEYLSG